MGVVKIWFFLKGYVTIRVEGLTLERFLNLAAANDIYLWDIYREGYTILRMKVTIEGFRALKGIVKRVGCKVEIIDKKGLPFIFYRLKQRKMLAFGFVLFLGIIFFLSSLIWNIEILGNEKVKTEDIIKILEKENIKHGIIKYKIDKDYIKYLLLNEFDIFSFLSVEIKGTKMIIEVKEQDLPPEKINKDIPCNIVATKKGVIVKAIARNGKAVVRKGDVVDEGQILIIGTISDEYSKEKIFVHAEGEVLAKTIYSYRIDEPVIKVIKEETGNIFERMELRIGEKGIQFVKGEIPFANYVEEVREIKPFNLDIDLPVKILVHQYKEVEVKEVKQNIDFLKKTTHIKAVEELNKQLPKDAQIQSKDVKYYLKDDVLSTYVTMEVIENIGKKEIIHER
ncbi:sporulation protein YqfD [Tepidimicrobium xylanilyticum]|uniref:Similar to stage IV sporulation protein n=1 Tax=Tepidimicrobium xylanilyticum TaxID=1123352 RepID=A0A1H2T4H5_9FIRM|nr:sporulation protein YqfD [Tepidimicrobium xylanilyticum]GMG96042.1 sporulation protein YqfD [Tepidimicrobium xylanilyticum]SDW38134.1 similar to stage IV sporulation protein [Tepidimicrobium xylanilyticum]